MNPIIERILDLAIDIQQVPAPTFEEGERAEFVRNCFLEEKDPSVELDKAGNVLACLQGSGGAAPIIVSAHLDTVFPQSTNLKYSRDKEKIFGPGIGDNSTGVAGLFGLLWMLKERNFKLPGDLWLIGNVGEEGLGNLKGMKAVIERFGNLPKAYIILEGMALGHIYNRALGVRRYMITINTSGGHSWADFGRPSAVHVLSKLASRITRIKLPVNPRTTLNVGKISGGTSINTIASEANMELDLRSEQTEAVEGVAEKVHHLAMAAQKKDVQVNVEMIGSRPAGEIAPDHPLVKLSQECLEEQGLQPVLNLGSTDANLPLSMGLPAVTIGLTNGSGAHTVHEYIFTEPLTKGVEQVFRLVTRLGNQI